MRFEQGKPNLTVFSDTLIELGKENKNLTVVTSDSRGSGKLVPFADELPDQIIEVGIAEQNLVGIAAGLASAGKTVFAVSPASFLTARALEQIKNDVAYSDNAVNLIGISSGISYGALGATHHAIHDFAVLRCINNIIVIAPADNFEAAEAVKASADLDKPVYIRFGKRPLEHLYEEPHRKFTLGRANILRDGADAVIVATGETVYFALAAAAILEKEGIQVRVLSMHTIKPLDEAVIIQSAEECRVVVTVEEHSVYGGLGEACAAVLLQNRMSRPLKIVGLPDEHLVNGSQMEMFDHYGISAQGICQNVKDLLKFA